MVGRMPVVFNCSEDASLKFIYTFILGIYEAQVYGVFDEFNRISTKNLSIISTSFSEFEEKKRKIIPSVSLRIWPGNLNSGTARSKSYPR